MLEAYRDALARRVEYLERHGMEVYHGKEAAFLSRLICWGVLSALLLYPVSMIEDSLLTGFYLAFVTFSGAYVLLRGLAAERRQARQGVGSYLRAVSLLMFLDVYLTAKRVFVVAALLLIPALIVGGGVAAVALLILAASLSVYLYYLFDEEKICGRIEEVLGGLPQEGSA